MPGGERVQRRDIPILQHQQLDRGENQQQPNHVDWRMSSLKFFTSFTASRSSIFFTREMMNLAEDSSSSSKLFAASLLGISSIAGLYSEIITDRERQAKVRQEQEGGVETSTTQSSTGFLDRWHETVIRGLDLAPVVITAAATEYAYNKGYNMAIVFGLSALGAIYGATTSYTERR